MRDQNICSLTNIVTTHIEEDAVTAARQRTLRYGERATNLSRLAREYAKLADRLEKSSEKCLDNVLT